MEVGRDNNHANFRGQEHGKVLHVWLVPVHYPCRDDAAHFRWVYRFQILRDQFGLIWSKLNPWVGPCLGPQLASWFFKSWAFLFSLFFWVETNWFSLQNDSHKLDPPPLDENAWLKSCKIKAKYCDQCFGMQLVEKQLLAWTFVTTRVIIAGE